MRALVDGQQWRKLLNVFIIACLLCTSIAPTFAAQNGAKLIAAANIQFAKGNYAEAGSLYKLALSSPDSLNFSWQEAFDCFFRLAVVLDHQGLYEEAVKAWSKTLVLAERAVGPDHPTCATMLLSLGRDFERLERNQEAETALKRVLKIRQIRQHAVSKSELLESINELARFYEAQERYAEAVALDRKALALQKSQHAPFSPEMELCLYNLARVLTEEGKYAEAETLWMQLLAIHKRTPPNHLVDRAFSLYHLALMREAENRLNEAEPLYRQVITLRDKVKKENDALLMRAAFRLGNLYSSRKEFFKAELFYKRGLAIEEALIRASKELTVTTDHFDALALLYAEQKRYSDASDVFKRALGIIESRLETDDKRIGYYSLLIGRMTQLQEKHDEAVPFFTKALVIAEKSPTESIDDLPIILVGLAQARMNQQKYAEAEQLYQRAINISKERSQSNHLLMALRGHADACSMQSRSSESENSYKQALSVSEKLSPEDPSEVRLSLVDLSDLYVGLGRYEESEALLKRALSIAETGTGDQAIILSRLGALYLEQRKTAAAESAFTDARKIAQGGSIAPEDLADIYNGLAECSVTQGRFDEGETFLWEALKIAEPQVASNPKTVINSLFSLASLLSGRDADKAEKLVLKAQKLIQQYLPPGHQSLRTARALLFTIQRRSGDEYQAERSIRELVESSATDTASDRAWMLMALASTLFDRKRYEAAEQTLERAFAMIENSPTDSELQAVCLANLGCVYSRQGQYGAARDKLSKALAVAESTLSSTHPGLILILTDLADLELVTRRYESAEVLLKRVLDIAKEHKATDYVSLRGSTASLSIVYQATGRYAEAEELVERFQLSNPRLNPVMSSYSNFTALAARSRRRLISDLSKEATAFKTDSLVFDPESSVAEQCMFADALELRTLKRMDEREHPKVMKDLEQVLHIRETLLGADDPQTAETLVQIATWFASTGFVSIDLSNRAYRPLTAFAKSLTTNSDKPKAEALGSRTRRSYEVVISRFGSEAKAKHFAASSLLSLANLLAASGERDKAVESLELSERCLRAIDTPPPSLILDLLIVANSWRAMGDYSKAFTVIDHAMSIIPQNLSAAARYACLRERVQLELEQGDYDQALMTCKELLRASNLAPSENRTDCLVTTYTMLGQASIGLRDYSAAVEYLNYAWSLIKGNKNYKDHPLLLRLRATALSETGNMSDAIECFNTLKESSQSSGIASLWETAGELHLKAGRYERALSDFDAALTLSILGKTAAGALRIARNQNHIAQTEYMVGKRLTQQGKLKEAIFASERAFEHALDSSTCFDKYLRTSYHGLDIGQQCAFLSRVKEQRDALLNASKSGAALSKAYTYMMKWKGLLLLSLSAARKEQTEALASHVIPINPIPAKARQFFPNSFDQDQTDLSGESKDVLWKLDTDAFREKLRSEEAFVDLMAYKPFDEESQRYVAIVIKHSAEPCIVDIGPKSEIDQKVQRWRSSVIGRIGGQVRDLQSANEPDEQLFAGVTAEEFQALTNYLATLTIRHPQITHYLGDDVHKLWICPEDALALVPWNGLALMLDNCPYSISEVDSPRDFVSIRESSPSTKGQKSALIAGIEHATKDWDRLPGAAIEVRAIKKLATKAHFQVTCLEEEKASRAAVCRDMGGASYVHIATHGFSEDKLSAAPLSDEAKMDDAGLLAARNPLTECGLLLAPPDGKRSGLASDRENILLANDITMLNLDDCELVTLSACQTGLGRQLDGQGVIGLRSAFRAAGADSVLMSLWSVPDSATRVLMNRFYQNLWEKGWSKEKSLTDAQLYVKSQSLEWSQPGYWAAWILVGE